MCKWNLYWGFRGPWPVFNLTFPQEDFKISLDENEAFLLSDPNTKALYQENYEATSGLYYESQPSFQSLLDTILNVIQKL